MGAAYDDVFRASAAFPVLPDLSYGSVGAWSSHASRDLVCADWIGSAGAAAISIRLLRVLALGDLLKRWLHCLSHLVDQPNLGSGLCWSGARVQSAHQSASHQRDLAANQHCDRGGVFLSLAQGEALRRSLTPLPPNANGRLQ